MQGKPALVVAASRRNTARAVAAGLLLAWLTAVSASAAQKEYRVTGMVVNVDAAAKWFAVSHGPIEGFMEAMTMPFEVRAATELAGVVRGALVEFTLVVGDRAAYATRIVVKPYETTEQDPRTARRLSVMKRMSGLATAPVSIGARVPDFALTDQLRRPVWLSGLAGKVVVVNFVYTRCALPQFCLRMSNNFGALQRRFSAQLGRDLVLLTVTFDPARDTPDALAAYASRWQADPSGWHFLTGANDAVARVCALFRQEAFPEEGLLNHSLHTAVIDRSGTLVANIEGNRFTPEQLGDLVLETLRQ